MGVAVSSQYFEYAIAHFEDGYVEGTAAKVIYQYSVVIGFVDTVCKSCCSRFVDDTQYFEASDFTSVFSSLTLAIREVCRNGDYCLMNGFTKIFFSVVFQFLQYHCGNFFRRVFLAVDFYFVGSTHMTFNGAYSSVRVGNSLAFCQLANKAFTVFGEANYGRGQAATFLVSDNSRFATFHNSNNRVSST